MCPPKKCVFSLDSAVYRRPSGTYDPVEIYKRTARRYDVTAFLNQHPGGGELLTAFAGRDATAAFEMVQHSHYARAMLDRYVIFDPALLVGFELKALEDVADREAIEARKVLRRHGYHESRLPPPPRPPR